jgi:adenine-specific DNA-methyltransferase
VIGEYVRIGQQWLTDALTGKAKYRPHDKPIYDHTKSPLSKIPKADSVPLLKFGND